MHSATCSIWSREMKQKVSDETGAIHRGALRCAFWPFENDIAAPLRMSILLNTLLRILINKDEVVQPLRGILFHECHGHSFLFYVLEGNSCVLITQLFI